MRLKSRESVMYSRERPEKSSSAYKNATSHHWRACLASTGSERKGQKPVAPLQGIQSAKNARFHYRPNMSDKEIYPQVLKDMYICTSLV